jgi:aldose 1-epimerase
VSTSLIAAPPSGVQHVIADGVASATVTEVGATLRSYRIGEIEVLDGFGEDEMCSSGRGQILAPWPNRLEDGRYRLGDREGVAALNEPERGNAIHGLVRWLPWAPVSRSDAEIVLGCDLHPQPGYPWRLRLETTYEITPVGLRASARAMNRSGVVAPFGIGFHPYLAVATEKVDDAVVTIPAATRLVMDERGLPVGREPVEGTGFDFSSGRPLGATVLDTAYTDLIRTEAGRAEVTVRDPIGRRSVTLWADRSFAHLMVYTGDTLEPAERRRHGIAVEPMTCPPNAFRTHTDVVMLEPGGAWQGTWGIDPQGTEGGRMA